MKGADRVDPLEQVLSPLLDGFRLPDRDPLRFSAAASDLDGEKGRNLRALGTPADHFYPVSAIAGESDWRAERSFLVPGEGNLVHRSLGTGDEDAGTAKGSQQVPAQIRR